MNQTYTHSLFKIFEITLKPPFRIGNHGDVCNSENEKIAEWWGQIDTFDLIEGQSEILLNKVKQVFIVDGLSNTTTRTVGRYLIYWINNATDLKSGKLRIFNPHTKDHLIITYGKK